MKLPNEQRKEALRALRAMAFTILTDLKEVRKKNKELRNWTEENKESSKAFKEAESLIEIWTTLLNSPGAKLIAASGAERRRQDNYCGHYFDFKSSLDHLNQLIRKEEKDLNERLGFTAYYYKKINADTIEVEKEFFNGLGYFLNSRITNPEFLSSRIEIAFKRLSSIDMEEFEAWEAKGKGNKKGSKGKRVKTTEIKVENAVEGITIKSFCCSVMGAIRDFMIKEGVEDYKNATCELGKARKIAVRSLVCYSKTQDNQKVKNFKEQLRKSPYSSGFANWPELQETIKSLEASFVE